LYDASVDYLDDQVGGFLDTLAADGVLEDTVVVIVSDHGQDLGEDGRFGHQFTVSEETVRVPLMVRAPGLEPARVAEQVELRALYDAVPRLAGLDDGDGTVAAADIAKGGYAEPQLDLQRLPAEKQAVYRKALSFVRGRGQKVVREENGDAVIRAAALATGDAVEPDAELLAALDGIGAAAEGETDVTDEQVKERLEDLGYM
ncbi:MAG: sulfatase-like hydrolase/transferase, partial [Candidatus Nanohaloarchaea archaeon]|nr:sulfatase-like hydrolase/transferase [Candidatus Nanohaloarchaea archaeon]